MNLRRRLSQARVRIRRTSAGWRELPDFLVIGGQRCGTSSLYKYLSNHPDVIGSIRKETEYFSFNFGLGEDWYRAHFPVKAFVGLTAALRDRRPLIFEASPGYLLAEHTPKRVASVLPKARFIVMLRNPVDRAYSQYLHNRRLHQEPLSFQSALAAEDSRIKVDPARIDTDLHYDSRALQRFSYVRRGLYADQLTRWFAQFDRKQFHILRSEDFYVDTPAAFRSVLDFLDLAPWSPTEFRNFTYRGSRPIKDKMPKEAQSYLLDKFREPNDRLAALIGMDWH